MIEVWDLYFASIVGFTAHPGYEREGTKKPTVAEAAAIADQMMAERNKRTYEQLEGNEQWQCGPQSELRPPT